MAVVVEISKSEIVLGKVRQGEENWQHGWGNVVFKMERVVKESASDIANHLQAVRHLVEGKHIVEAVIIDVHHDRGDPVGA